MLTQKKYIGKTHPINTEFLRKFIADNSFFILVLYYLFINILLGLLIAILLFTTSSEEFINCYLYSLFGLLGQELNVLIVDYTSSQVFISFIIRFLSIILPTALLGLIVYKLFIIPNIFIFRNNIAFFKNDANEDVLSIRFYNGTNLKLSPVEVQIYARIKKYRKSGEPYLENHKIFMKIWPISFPKVPFSIYLPVISHNKGERSFIIKYENEEILINEETKLFIMINGNISKLDKNFSEEHFINLASIDFKKFTDIHVDYDAHPSSWIGWKSFNE